MALDSPAMQSGAIQFQPQWTLDAMLGQQLGTFAYLLHPETARSENLKTFGDNASVWRAVLSERARAEMAVKLENFFLLEWFPRTPGLYHTEDALRARLEAASYIDPRFARRGKGEHTAVFLPEGKSSMLQGGVGCIRLKPIALGSQVYWFMTATSSGIAHEGFPLAVPKLLYERHIDQLTEHGAVPCTVVGRLRFLPAPVSYLLDSYRGVPRLYLEVEDILSGRLSGAEPEVSVAVSFVSSYQGRPGVYATYVTFEPGRRGSFESSIDWLKNTYVEQMYGGRILTDFDQTTTHFPEAALSLRKIMSRQLRQGDIQQAIELMHAAGQPAYLLERLDLADFAAADGMVARTRVFISYSRRDRGWVERLKVFLKPLVDARRLDIWDDSQIPAGSQWEAELDSAIESARIAILLITADFVASDFIQQRELPKFLTAAEARQLTVLPVFIGVSAASEDPRITKFQAVNTPETPLNALPESDQEAVFNKLRQDVTSILGAA